MTTAAPKNECTTFDNVEPTLVAIRNGKPASLSPCQVDWVFDQLPEDTFGSKDNLTDVSPEQARQLLTKLKQKFNIGPELDIYG